MIYITNLLLLVVISVTCMCNAVAGESSAFNYSANVGLASDYSSRGLRLNWRNPALQGGAELQRASGLYLGTWASQVSDRFFANGKFEIDLYAGQRAKFAHVFNYDIGIDRYFYPGANYSHAVPAAASQTYDTTEAILSLGTGWFSLKYYYTLTDYYGYNATSVPVGPWNSGITGGIRPGGDTRGSTYVEANVTSGLSDRFGLQFHAGHQTIRNSVNLNYSDYRVGLTADFRSGWIGVLSLSTTRNAHIFRDYLAVDGSGQMMDPAATHWVASISRTF